MKKFQFEGTVSAKQRKDIVKMLNTGKEWAHCGKNSYSVIDKIGRNIIKVRIFKSNQPNKDVKIILA